MSFYLFIPINKHTSLLVTFSVQGAAVGANPNDPTTAVQPKDLFSVKGTLEPSTTIIGTESKIGDGVLVLNVICLPHKELSQDCRNQIIL